MKSYRSTMGKVKGLGSAHRGTEHWWHQRVTAVLLIPLTIWFLTSCLCLDVTNYQIVRGFFSSTWQAVLMLIYIATLCYHAYLGVTVVIEDYVHGKFTKYTSLILLKAGFLFTVFLATFSIFKIAFGE